MAFRSKGNGCTHRTAVGEKRVCLHSGGVSVIVGNKYPNAIRNIKSAILWLKNHADQYDIDISRIVVAKSSAGRHLASLVGLTGSVSKFELLLASKHSTHIQAIINLDGVVDFMAPLSLSLERKPDSPDAFWLGGTFAEKPLIWKEASPIFWAREEQKIPIYS
jgi:acetyl esterase/lipase